MQKNFYCLRIRRKGVAAHKVRSLMCGSVVF